MKSKTLFALTASALALPGLSSKLHADAAPDTSTLSYRISSYSEDELAAADLLIGSPERYDIDIHQFRLLMPVGENYSLALNSSYESMSGASPWYTLNDAQGNTKVIMSGASISEQRRDLNASVRRYLDNGTVGLNLGASRENDYDSYSLGFDAEHHFNHALTTVSGGFSFASDDLSPTDAALFTRINAASKQGRSVFVSLTQILNRNSLLQSGISVTHLNGYLTDPYKLGDKRPDSRTQLAWNSAYRHFIDSANAAVHVDYRYYHDSFGINSHTIDMSWYQNLGKRMQLVPGLRYYSQSAADFFTPASNFANSTYNSADYRLSAYGAFSYTLSLHLQFDKIRISADAERYQSAPDRGIHAGSSSPALVDFTRLGIGFDYSF